LTPGSDVIILKIISPKNGEKVAILNQITVIETAKMGHEDGF
jgi:hypothetical protein